MHGRGEGRSRGEDFELGVLEVSDFGVAGGGRFNHQRDAVLHVFKEAKPPAGGVVAGARVDFEMDSLRLAKEKGNAAQR